MRAGKYADFEGGVRVNAFASGGLIPKERRGTVSDRYIHISDIYASFIRLAWFGKKKAINEVELHKRLRDPKAEKAGLPPPDSLDTLWPAILDSPGPVRNEVWLSANAIIIGEYKLITGQQPQDIWQVRSFGLSLG